MSAKTENNQFYRGRKDILGEFEISHRTLMSGVAGRNFSKAPGFLFEASIMLEEVGKNKLSALNFQIVSEAVERELKQTGHDYTQTYKAARIAFELEKQTLLTALQQEFADLDATQSLTEEELNRQFVELDIRRLILITTKTAIDLEMEDLRQELIAVDRLTFTNEELLINEKVTTATAKLAIIPYIEAIIRTQERLLIAEEANIPYMEELIVEKGLLINKKTELIPDLVVRAAKQEILAETLSQQIAFKKQILTAAIDKILLKTDIIDNKIAILDAEILVEDMRQLLNIEKYNLHEAKLDKEINLLATDIENLENTDIQRGITLTELQVDRGQLRTDSEESEGNIVGDDIIKAEAIRSSQTIEEKNLIIREKITRVADIRDSADAAASAKITSKLIHLIGG